ncbi:MAG: glycosyl transferase family protein, partial [Parcubacteria group bacterium Gr01-1014_70]
MIRQFFESRIAVLILMVVLVSAAYSFYYHDRPRVDAEAYDAIARNLAEGYGYVEHRANAAHPELDDAIVRVGPGYEFFLAGIYKVFGRHIWIVWILHALLRGASVVLIYAIARLLFPSRGDVWFLAAGFFGLAPDLIVVNGLLLTETLFLFFFLYAVYETLRLFYTIGNETERMPLKHIFYSGILWSLTILTRPTALLPYLLSSGTLLWQKRFSAALLFLLPAFLLIGPWSYYMSTRYDSFIFTTTAGGLDLWVGNNPDATGGFVKTPEIQNVRNTYHSVEFSRIAWRKYVEFLTGDPFSFLELQWRKTAIFFSLMRPTGFWIHLAAYPWDRFLTLLVSGAWTGILMIGGLAGASMFWNERERLADRLFVAFAALQPLAVIPLIVETRYRYALFPFLAVFAAYFFTKHPLRFRI